MGTRARRKKKSFLRKNGLSVCILAVAVLSATAILFAFLTPPDAKVLKKAGIDFEKCRRKKDVVTLTFAGDARGVLDCRQALSVLRAETFPETVIWRAISDGEVCAQGQIDHASVPSGATAVRVETLAEDLTLLKVRYELEQCGLTATAEACPTVGTNGKTLRVQIETNASALETAAVVFPSVLTDVNDEGGGIVRCDVLFYEADTLIAAVSYDFLYRDILVSSALKGIVSETFPSADLLS